MRENVHSGQRQIYNTRACSFKWMGLLHSKQKRWGGERNKQQVVDKQEQQIMKCFQVSL